jgi:hypothetical protein
LYVLHRCDNPSCINPLHLDVGTQKQNMQDSSRKGRCQEGHGKLTADKVREILSDPRPGRVIAKEIGVGKSTIAAIKGRQSWRHITCPAELAP